MFRAYILTPSSLASAGCIDPNPPEIARSAADRLPDELGDPLAAEAERLTDVIGEESVGEMYSLALRLPERRDGSGSMARRLRRQ